MSTLSHQRAWLYFLLFLAIAVNFSGLFVVLLGADGPLYASIARTMVEKGNYVELFSHGTDWLDKPHFPFWVTAFSFEVFGFTTWAYKLPAILFLLLGVWYTYLLARKLYDEKTAYWAVIILLTAQHIVISNNDVRAEPYLTGLIIGSIYHFYRPYTEKKNWQLVLGSLFAACAVMTKGPFAIIPIAGAIGGELLLKKNWPQLFHLRWLIAALLIFLFITPELYCLWYQFDQHPEKVVFGRTGVSGIRFFFWDSQFGRFLNTGPIKGKGDPAFFLHTLIWAFLPWSLVLYMALTRTWQKRWRRSVQHVEWLSLSGAFITLLIFSLSKFQLPHYSNIIFPLLAILLSGYLQQVKLPKEWKAIHVVQTIVIIIMVIAPLLLHYFFRPAMLSWPALLLIFVLIILLIFLPRIGSFPSKTLLFYRTALAALIVNFYLNSIAYPSIMHYQAGSEAAFYSNKKFPHIPVVQLRKDYSYALTFYLQSPVITIDSLQQLEKIPYSSYLLYAPDNETEKLISEKPMPIKKEFDYFPVSMLNGKFINYKTREEELSQFALVLMSEPELHADRSGK
ncbi:MAG TPA: glycosyltransferase family 39 protein [Chitinophagaceae bacterium]|nr:glycosyltransferase family 39 protein [Chitinophagaceae bacterium]